MTEIMHEAGWPIYLVLAFGSSALLLSIRHAIIPERNNLTLIAGLGLLTLLWGALGTSLGLQCSIAHIPNLDPEARWIVWVGLRESLNNLSSALILAILAAAFATIGAARLGSRTTEPERRN